MELIFNETRNINYDSNIKNNKRTMFYINRKLDGKLNLIILKNTL